MAFEGFTETSSLVRDDWPADLVAQPLHPAVPFLPAQQLFCAFFVAQEPQHAEGGVVAQAANDQAKTAIQRQRMGHSSSHPNRVAPVLSRQTLP